MRCGCELCLKVKRHHVFGHDWLDYLHNHERVVLELRPRADEPTLYAFQRDGEIHLQNRSMPLPRTLSDMDIEEIRFGEYLSQCEVDVYGRARLRQLPSNLATQVP